MTFSVWYHLHAAKCQSRISPVLEEAVRRFKGKFQDCPNIYFHGKKRWRSLQRDFDRNSESEGGSDDKPASIWQCITLASINQGIWRLSKNRLRFCRCSPEQLLSSELMTRVGFCFSHVGQVTRPVFSWLRFLHGHCRFSLSIPAHGNSPEIIILSGSFFVVCLFLLQSVCFWSYASLLFQLPLSWSLSWAVKDTGCKGAVFNSLF